MSRSFVHLHCHSHYSLLDGASPIDRLIAKAKSSGMNALAITDHGNLYGALEFYQKAKAAEIKPIIGYEAYIAPGSRTVKEAPTGDQEASYHLTLLAKNRTGFKNLIKLASYAYLEGFYRKPRIDKELLKAHSDGLVCLSGCVSGELSRTLLRTNGAAEPDWDAARRVAAWFYDIFGDRYFLEVQNNGLEIQRLALEGTVEIARRMGIPLVATSDAHYVDRQDSEAQDVLLCINTGKFRTDKNRMKMEGNEFYLRAPDEMYAAFPGMEEAVSRSQEIADTVDINLDLGKRYFPTLPIPPERTPSDFLHELCVQGLKERYAKEPGMLTPEGELSQAVVERLDRELRCINKLGFANYFLVVWDFVRYAVEEKIPCSARGSGVGSIVAYALKLSHVCPLKYDLLFERFLDESRKEAPDIDIDFCKDRRGDVIQYVKRKYGKDNVAQIGTFGTLAARAAIRDVGRALSWPIPKVDDLVSKVPEELGIELAEALTKSADLKKQYDADPETRELYDLAMKIEGLARNVGTHAAAVVIADSPLIEYVPLQHVQGKEEVITQWAMADVEKAGLLKMDFLGLRNLTVLAKTVELIEQSTGTRIDPYDFPLDDEPTYALLRRGETKGVFQLESGGIRDLLQRMKPDHFRDIIATNALYRPGPLEGGMVDEYIEVKLGRKKAEYLHPVMKEVLEETHGVMVYQEQVMRILNRLGDIELPNAYTCIKAISKKKLEMIARYRAEFVSGCKAKGLTEAQATNLFEMIEKFAGYGFNKCLVGDTEIIDADTGERLSIGELFKHRRPMRIHSLAEDGKLVKRQVTDVVWNGRRRVYRIRTKLGRILTATGNHPLRTFGGWTNVDHLKPGDRIAAPRRLDIAGDRRWPEHEVVTLAGLLSEGNTCHPTCLYFYNNDRPFVDDFVLAVERFPRTKARIDLRRDTRFEVCVSTGTDTRIGAEGVARTAVKGLRCGAHRWAESLGILGKRASEKFVPTEVFRLPDDQVELFLGRLWSGDGFVGAAGQMPFYATSSLQLACDVQTLLLRLGVTARVATKLMRYRYKGVLKERPGYTVHLVGDRSVRVFLVKLAPHMIGRDRRIAAYREYLDSVRPATSKDTIPPEVRTLVDAERRAAQLGWRQLEAESGLSMKEFVGRGSAAKQGFRRATISRLAGFFESQALRDVAESDVYWDRIESIEPAGTEDVYDLTVDGEHNFVADGLVVHNSHSTAYALIAYMTAYLKAHYPVEFMAALLCGDIEGRNFKKKDSLVEHLEDCRRMNITVMPPDVNTCDADFSVHEGKIYFGLAGIKGCGGSAAKSLAAERRENGNYKDLFDFCGRNDSSTVNRTAIESLVKAGALDQCGGTRAQWTAVLDKALQSAASVLADKKRGQKALFGADDEEEAEAGKPAVSNLPYVPDWDSRQQMAGEKEVLGFYLSSHPLAEYQEKFETFCSHNTTEAAQLTNRTECILGGMIAAIKFSHTKNPRPGQVNTKYAMWDLEDMSGIMRCILWPEDFAKHGHLVEADRILAVRGVIDKRPGSEEANFIVNELIPIEQLESRYTKGIIVRVDETKHGEQGLQGLFEILRCYPGTRDVQLVLNLADRSRVVLASDGVKVEPGTELRQRILDYLGEGSMRLLTAEFRPTPPQPKKYGGRQNGG